MRRRAGASWLFVAAVLLAPAQEAGARQGEPRRSESSHGLLRAVYGWDGAAAHAVFGAADASAYPVFASSLPVTWGLRLAHGGDRTDAVRLTVATLAAAAVVRIVKPALAKRRPFDVLHDLPARTRYRGARDLDRYAMPSGHATLSAVIAVSVSLSHPEPYVIVPAAAWAAAVGVSRVWLGVHWPRDVVAGWALGAALAAATHAALPDRDGTRVPPVRFVVSL